MSVGLAIASSIHSILAFRKPHQLRKEIILEWTVVCSTEGEHHKDVLSDDLDIQQEPGRRPERLVLALLDLAEQYGYPTADGIQLRVK